MIVPDQPVAHGREQAAGGDHVVVGHIEVQAIGPTCVGLRESGHDACEVVAPLRIRHAQRRKDALRGELCERHAAHALHHGAQQQEARVRVRVVVADGIIQRLLVRDQFEHIALRVHPRTARPPLPRHEVAPFAQPARMREQMPERDGAPVHRQLGQHRARVVVEAQLAVVHEQHDGRGGELFRHRARLQDGTGENGAVAGDVGHAVAAGEQHLTALRNADGASRRVGGVPRRENLVGHRGEVGVLSARGAGDGHEQERDGDSRRTGSDSAGHAPNVRLPLRSGQREGDIRTAARRAVLAAAAGDHEILLTVHHIRARRRIARRRQFRFPE